MARIEDIGYGLIFHPDGTESNFDIPYHREKIKQFKSKFSGKEFKTEEEWQKAWNAFEPEKDWKL